MVVGVGKEEEEEEKERKKERKRNNMYVRVDLTMRNASKTGGKN